MDANSPWLGHPVHGVPRVKAGEAMVYQLGQSAERNFQRLNGAEQNKGCQCL